MKWRTHFTPLGRRVLALDRRLRYLDKRITRLEDRTELDAMLARLAATLPECPRPTRRPFP